jgi:8-amino-3,8-dideoxy-alpha-D-manno-octulosonate transaminase
MVTFLMIETQDVLAVRGGPKSVTEPAPANWLHGTNEIGEEEIRAVTAVMRSKVLFRYAHDPSESPVAQLEALFASKTGARYALGVNSGTSALIAGLIALKVSQGDEVLIPAYTYIATAAAVMAVGALPVLVEMDESLTMDPKDMERKITDRTTAVIPVHMRGVPCDMGRIMEIARRRKIAVLEDCAQANGGTFAGRSLGTFGDAGIFSLQHYKIIACGEGGILITNDREVYERAAVYHDSAYAFWMEQRAGSPDAAAQWKRMCFLGENFRQSELHGAVALEQLKKRDRVLARTRLIKSRLWPACEEIPGAEMEALNDRAGDCGISLVFFMPDAASAVEIAAALDAEGVRCGTVFSKQFPDRHIFYHWDYVMDKRSAHRNGAPWALEQKPPRVSYSKDMCPRTIAFLERAVMLPITQIMADAYVEQVVGAIQKVARNLKG